MTQDSPNAPDDPLAEHDTRRLWRRILASTEGKILLLGLLVLLSYAAMLLVVNVREPSTARTLFNMTVTHTLAGRAGGMSLGYARGFTRRTVTAVSMVIETYMVLLFYPLFFLSYSKLIVIKPLVETMARAHRAAEEHRSTIKRFGIPGLIAFVWFPFMMTGPLVGSVIGFLIGLRPVTNMVVVLLATYMAIFCWGILLSGLSNKLAKLGPYVQFAFVAAVILVAISIHVRYAFMNNSKGVHPEDEPENAGD